MELLVNFCQVNILTIVYENRSQNFFFEPMKVAINQQIQAKLINKIFVKKTNCMINDSVYKDYFWFWHYMCNLT